jgi:hypothetical protein
MARLKQYRQCVVRMWDNVRTSDEARSAVLVTGAPQWAHVGHAGALVLSMALYLIARP